MKLELISGDAAHMKLKVTQFQNSCLQLHFGIINGDAISKYLTSKFHNRKGI